MRIVIIALFCISLGLAIGYHFGAKGISGLRPQSDTEAVRAEQSQQQPSGEASAEETGVVGRWRSVEDPRFTREFREDGVVIDRYEGDEGATSEGSWALFEYPTDEPVPFTIQPGVRYLRVSFLEEVLYFSITSVDEKELELVYLGVGQTLRFQRI